MNTQISYSESVTIKQLTGKDNTDVATVTFDNQPRL